MSNVLIEAIGELQAMLEETKDLAAVQAVKLAEYEVKTDNRKKLSKLDVGQIRMMTRPNGPYTQRETADQFRINRGTVSRIMAGKYHA